MRRREELVPWRCVRRREVGDARDLLADGAAFVAVHPPFALLEVHRAARQAPVAHDLAVLVEVQPLLAHPGCTSRKQQALDWIVDVPGKKTFAKPSRIVPRSPGS